MTIKILSYDELPDWVDKTAVSNNGSGKEYASYLVIEDGDYRFYESDAMEGEDCKFYRDLKWVKDEILAAQERGFIKGWNDCKAGKIS